VCDSGLDTSNTTSGTSILSGSVATSTIMDSTDRALASVANTMTGRADDDSVDSTTSPAESRSRRWLVCWGIVVAAIPASTVENPAAGFASLDAISASSGPVTHSSIFRTSREADDASFTR
jgi:hypothetical protein